MQNAKKKLTKAAERFAVAAAKGDRAQINACVSELFDMLRKLDDSLAAILRLEEHQAAFAYATQNDIPLPLSAYRHWGSRGTLRALVVDPKTRTADWSRIGAFTHAGKLYIKPSDFARALKQNISQSH